MKLQFDPIIQTWFEKEFKGPTSVQKLAWEKIQQHESVLVAAPTGSGKTLAAFLAVLSQLLEKARQGELEDKTYILYISPLKALNYDIEKNLNRPLAFTGPLLEKLGLAKIRCQARTGDTSAKDRQAMTKKPPHILVTTPESFFIQLTSAKARLNLAKVQTVIVDEIHALAPDRRGSHLMLSLERLETLRRQNGQLNPLQRIGLSATQKPLKTIGKFLMGGQRPCHLIDEGHIKNWDIECMFPDSPLEAVMSNEVWTELHHKLVHLIENHQTTLIFVHTRRLAERLTHQLAPFLGEAHIAAHHGSMASEKRLHAEQQLKSGKLKALVATASLELGIDIGAVDLVCHMGAPRSIASFLQRIGRARHQVGGIPKGRLFPLTREEALDCLVTLEAVKQGKLETTSIPEIPIDIALQHIVAAAANETWEEKELFELFQKAYPFRKLKRNTFDDMLDFLANGYPTQGGRRGAYIFHDKAQKKVWGRKGARLTAITSGGAIPDKADYKVQLVPENSFIGTLDEDFAVESMAGDIFTLGTHSWRVQKIGNGTVFVEDAAGLPPTIPFWFGEAPARSQTLTQALAQFYQNAEIKLKSKQSVFEPGTAKCQLNAYLETAFQVFGCLPNQERVIAERFFDDSGGMQLVIHAPFGSRINRAWGLALRKRFCRSFNFELQAAATENAILISLSQKHSFPLKDIFEFVHSSKGENILIQAMLDAPVFQTRWRWNVARALAVPRYQGGKRVAPFLIRMRSEDLLGAVFPDQLACLENVAGDRDVPDHLLVQQTIQDCLQDFMDCNGWLEVLKGIESGKIQTLAYDLPEPSPLCHEILNAKPYAFLDDAPLEERRTQAVRTRRTLSAEEAQSFGQLNPQSIDFVTQQRMSIPKDDLDWVDLLDQLGLIEKSKIPNDWSAPPIQVCQIQHNSRTFLCNPDQMETFKRIWAGSEVELVPILSKHLALKGPSTALELSTWFAIPPNLVQLALARLESSGEIIRGYFDERLEGEQFCERHVLSAIHRQTLQGLRKAIRPMPSSHFYMMQLQWQRLLPEFKASEPAALSQIVEQFAGYQTSMLGWRHLLKARSHHYQAWWLDQLSMGGQLGWARCLDHKIQACHGQMALSLMPKNELKFWLKAADDLDLSPDESKILAIFDKQGALFFPDLVQISGLLKTQVEQVLSQLVAKRFITSDHIAGINYLCKPEKDKGKRKKSWIPQGIELGGRWHRLPQPNQPNYEFQARALLKRYGIVFRALAQSEKAIGPWRQLLRAFWQLEARGEVRCGRFVEHFSGQQFALPEAIPILRKVDPQSELWACVHNQDPAYFSRLSPNPPKSFDFVWLRNGIPVAARKGRALAWIQEPSESWKIPAEIKSENIKLVR